MRNPWPARVLLPLASLLLLLVPVAKADAYGDCDSKGYPALGIVTIGSGRGDQPYQTVYVDDRNYLLGNGVWIYIESNGRDGLQRGGSCWLVPGDNEICVDDPNYPPDWYVY